MNSEYSVSYSGTSAAGTSAVWYGATNTARADWTDYAWRPWDRQREKELLDSIVEVANLAVKAMTTTRTPGESGKEGNKPMKAVFNVLVVTKKGEILLDRKVVAKDRDEALFEADVSAVLKAKGLKPGDVTMLCVKLGDVEIEPEPQKVQIVEKGS